MALFDIQLLVDVAIGAVAILVTFLAIYLALRLLGKLAKLAVILIVVIFVLWLVFAEGSPLDGMILSLQGASLLLR